MRASLAWHVARRGPDAAAAQLVALDARRRDRGSPAADGLGLWPRSHALGSNWTRLPARAAARGEVGITIDDGPDPEITPQVLAILAEHGARATFFCIGERVEQFPLLARACVAQGHAVENHSQRHRHHFALYESLGACARELQQAQRSIERVCGVPPRFFRAPAGLRSPLLDPVLRRLGLQLASWTRRGFDTVNGDADCRAAPADRATRVRATSCCCTMVTPRVQRSGTAGDRSRCCRACSRPSNNAACAP